jgi:hypothetical protein
VANGEMKIRNQWLASIESVSIINGEMAAENNEKQSMAK